MQIFPPRGHKRLEWPIDMGSPKCKHSPPRSRRESLCTTRRSRLFFVMPNHTGTEALAFMLRWVHLVAAITWVGLLYFFNFVNVPFMKQVDAGDETEDFSVHDHARSAIIPLELDADRLRGLLVLVSDLCRRRRPAHGGQVRKHHRAVSADLDRRFDDSVLCDLENAKWLRSGIW